MADQQPPRPTQASISTACAPYFAEHVPLAGDQPLTAELIAGGRSNLTYAISNGTSTWVLRRPPLGHVLPTAHDMVREYRVLTALAGTGVPVPAHLRAVRGPRGQRRAVLRDGEGRRRHLPRRRRAHRSSTPSDARRLSEELVDVLARIHTVDYEQVGLGEFGHPDGFLERQVRRWGQQWERSKTRELPEVDEVARRLNAALPESGPADDRPRRLPARQHDDVDRRPGQDRRGARLGDVDARRPARRPRPLPPLLGQRGRADHRDRLGDRREGRVPARRRDRRALRREERPGRSTRSTGTSCSRPTSSRSSSRGSTPGSRWARPSVRASTRWARPSSRSSTARWQRANRSSIPALRG